MTKTPTYEGKEYKEIYPKIVSERHYILIGEKLDTEPSGKRGGRTERLGELRPRKGYIDVGRYKRDDGTPVKKYTRKMPGVNRKEAMKIQATRSSRAVSMDNRVTSKTVYELGSNESQDWRKNYNKVDIEGIDTKGS